MQNQGICKTTKIYMQKQSKLRFMLLSSFWQQFSIVYVGTFPVLFGNTRDWNWSPRKPQPIRPPVCMQQHPCTPLEEWRMDKIPSCLPSPAQYSLGSSDPLLNCCELRRLQHQSPSPSNIVVRKSRKNSGISKSPLSTYLVFTKHQIGMERWLWGWFWDSLTLEICCIQPLWTTPLLLITGK